MYERKRMDVGWYSINLEYSQDYNLTLKLINKGEIFIIKEFLSNMISGKIICPIQKRWLKQF